MKRLKMFILVLVLSIYLCSSLPGLATVTISKTCYNSHSALTEDITTVNALYADYTILLPDKILSKGGGMGLGDIDSSFSHEIIYLNGESSSKIGAALDTDSATYGWSKNLNETQEDKPFSMAVGYKLGDGKLITSCWNSQAEIAEDLTIVGGKYSGSAAIEPDAMASTGSGESENDAGESTLNHLVYTQNEGKWAWIELDQEGKAINYQWIKVAQASPNDAFIGLALKTNAENGEAVMEVVGEASDFPRQHLPPGRLVIYNYPVYDTTNTDSSTTSTPVYDIPEFGPPEELKFDLQEFLDFLLNGDGVQDSGIGGQQEQESSDQEPTEPQEYPLEARGTFDFALKMTFNTNSEP